MEIPKASHRPQFREREKQSLPFLVRTSLARSTIGSLYLVNLILGEWSFIATITSTRCKLKREKEEKKRTMTETLPSIPFATFRSIIE